MPLTVENSPLYWFVLRTATTFSIHCALQANRTFDLEKQISQIPHGCLSTWDDIIKQDVELYLIYCVAILQWFWNFYYIIIICNNRYEIRLHLIINGICSCSQYCDMVVIACAWMNLDIVVHKCHHFSRIMYLVNALCAEFNWHVKCPQKKYILIWHWSKMLLSTQKGMETVYQDINLILVRQILITVRITTFPYFPTKQLMLFTSRWGPAMFYY